MDKGIYELEKSLWRLPPEKVLTLRGEKGERLITVEELLSVIKEMKEQGLVET